MEPWLRFRFLEDRTCKQYSNCLTIAAYANKKFVPCYLCNGGRQMIQRFHCTKCNTMWNEDENEWVLTSIVTCPFCKHKNFVYIYMKGGKVVGSTTKVHNLTQENK